MLHLAYKFCRHLLFDCKIIDYLELIHVQYNLVELYNLKKKSDR